MLAVMRFYKGRTCSSVCGMGNTIADGIHFYDIGAAVVIIIVSTGIYIAFDTVVVSMHFIC